MTQGPLPLILLAAKAHPEVKFRQHLWSFLEDWLKDKSPPMSAETIDQKLRAETGTFLEPFRLDDEDLRVATFLTMLAFTKPSPASRFRVVSSNTLGNAGGLVITRGGGTFYSERYSLGNNRLLSSNLRFFAPSMPPVGPFGSKVTDSLQATMRSDEKGLYLDFPVSLLQRVGWVHSNPELDLKKSFKPLISNSVIGPKSLSLASLKVKFTADENGLCLAITKPEALIRFSSYVVQGSLLQLKAENDFEIAVQLPKTAEGPAPVTIVAGDSFASDWMNVEGLGYPNLERTDITAISDWAFQHVHWVNLT